MWIWLMQLPCQWRPEIPGTLPACQSSLINVYQFYNCVELIKYVIRLGKYIEEEEEI
jgi:hypothetical protein